MAGCLLMFLLFFGLFTPHLGNEADSTALGAKYLTQSEVASRDDCSQLCCETPTCDVFVYEHKRRGSCYLFHCGDPQEFKCKFTPHGNYSSGLLIPPNELESEIKLTKHEQELARLSKKTENIVETTSAPVPSTVKVPALIKNNTSERSECSRYQFECRSTRECIAIYNACDGIPQCPDGSDEGPELDCPTVAGTAKPSSRPNTKQHDHHEERIPSDVKKSYAPQQPVPYQQYGPEKTVELSQQAMEAQQQIMNQGRAYGREGEGPGEAQSQNSWRSYVTQQRHNQEDASRSFNHKNVGSPDGDSQPPVAYGSDTGRGQGSGNAPGYYGSNSFNLPPYWPLRQRDDPRWMYPGPPPPADYYYEESQMRARPPPSPVHQRLPEADQRVQEKTEISAAVPAEKTTLSKIDEGKEKEKDTLSVKKVIADSEPKLKHPTTTQVSHQAMGLVMNEDDVVILESDGENEHPRGAILSLALGMCIAAIMITLVGCRLRVVQRRLRRGGKSGYAHDADFLVNGMYL